MALTRDDWIQKKRRRYLAQILEDFDENILPLMPIEAAAAVQNFKGLVRAKVNALAVDAAELMALDDSAAMAQNGAAQELRERISNGRPE